ETVIRRDFGGTIWDELRVFYHALALAAMTPAGRDEGTPGTLEVLGERLARWAASSPHLFRLQHLIVLAEIARIGARDGDAIRLYELALEAATAAGYPREEGLAGERFARFRQTRGE